MPVVAQVDGYYGAGKSSFCDDLETLGYRTADMDAFTQPAIRRMKENKLALTLEERMEIWGDAQRELDAYVASWQDSKEPVVLCGANSVLYLHGKAVPLELDSHIPLFWLRVNRRTAMQRYQEREGRALTPEEIASLERSLKRQWKAFRDTNTDRPKRIRTPAALLRIFARHIRRKNNKSNEKG